MVTGKSGDTSQTKFADTSVMPATILQTLQNGKEYNNGNIKFIKATDNRYVSYKVQNADGIIATAKSSVEIAINLIGIMALFMGFMSIAERAGGIRLLSKIIGPFFSKLFPGLPRNHPAMGHMVINKRGRQALGRLGHAHGDHFFRIVLKADMSDWLHA